MPNLMDRNVGLTQILVVASRLIPTMKLEQIDDYDLLRCEICYRDNLNRDDKKTGDVQIIDKPEGKKKRGRTTKVV